jgi:photosystem II stability/assembly factor-like uncharacterized protein
MFSTLSYPAFCVAPIINFEDLVMKPLLPLLATTLLLLAGLSRADAQTVRWERIGAPEGGNVLSFARTPDGMLFATLDAAGVFRSSNDGGSWERLGVESNSRWSALIHATPRGTLLLGGADTTLRISTDKGATWAVVSRRIYGTVPLVEDSSGGVIGVGPGGLYRSTDDGLTWKVQGGTIEEVIGALAVGSDGRLVAAVQNGFSPRGIRVSTDMGASWSLVQLGDSNTPTVLSLAATRDGRLFAGTGGGGLFRSDDGGATWTLLPVSIPVYYSSLLVLSDGGIVASAGGQGVLRSDDGGANWAPVGPTDAGLQVSALGATKDGRILAGTFSSGVYAVEPVAWKRSSVGLPSLGIGMVSFAPDGTIHTVASDGRFYSSTDNGASWVEPNGRRSSASVLAVDHDGRIFADNVTYPDFGIAVSTDDGSTWTASGLNGEQPKVVLVDRNDDLYVGVERGGYSFHTSFTDGLFHSTDHGATWSTLGSGLQGVSPASIVKLEDGTLFIGAEYGERVYRLAPGDTSWQNMSAGLPAYRYPLLLNSLVADRAGNLYAGMQQGLYRSSDRGASWQSLNANIGDTTVNALLVSPTGTIFASTRRNGVHASDDNGASWHRYGDNPGSDGFHILAIDSSRALVGAGREGLFRAVTTSSVPLPIRDIDAALAVTPNPAGSRFTVAFDMPASGAARIALHNALGQEIAVVLDGEATRGSNHIDVDCSRCQPGRYFLQLETARGSRQIGVLIVR